MEKIKRPAIVTVASAIKNNDEFKSVIIANLVYLFSILLRLAILFLPINNAPSTFIYWNLWRKIIRIRNINAEQPIRIIEMLLDDRLFFTKISLVLFKISCVWYLLFSPIRMSGLIVFTITLFIKGVFLVLRL